MRRNLLFVLVLFMSIGLSANADMTVKEQTEPERLINSGYSEAMAEEVLIQENRSSGQPVEPLYEKKHNKFMRFCRNFYSYIDISQDDSERFHHNIKMSPSHTDL